MQPVATERCCCVVVPTSPQVSRVPALLVRRNALVVNLYSIKAVVLGARCFFFLRPGDDGVLQTLMEHLVDSTYIALALPVLPS